MYRSPWPIDVAGLVFSRVLWFSLTSQGAPLSPREKGCIDKYIKMINSIVRVINLKLDTDLKLGTFVYCCFDRFPSNVIMTSQMLHLLEFL